MRYGITHHKICSKWCEKDDTENYEKYQKKNERKKRKDADACPKRDEKIIEDTEASENSIFDAVKIPFTHLMLYDFFRFSYVAEHAKQQLSISSKSVNWRIYQLHIYNK